VFSVAVCQLSVINEYTSTNDKQACTHDTLWRQRYVMTSKEYSINCRILLKYFELVFLQLQLLKILHKLIIIWVNYDRKKKGFFFWNTIYIYIGSVEPAAYQYLYYRAPPPYPRQSSSTPDLASPTKLGGILSHRGFDLQQQRLMHGTAQSQFDESLENLAAEVQQVAIPCSF